MNRELGMLARERANLGGGGGEGKRNCDRRYLLMSTLLQKREGQKVHSNENGKRVRSVEEEQ